MVYYCLCIDILCYGLKPTPLGGVAPSHPHPHHQHHDYHRGNTILWQIVLSTFSQLIDSEWTQKLNHTILFSLYLGTEKKKFSGDSNV